MPSSADGKAVHHIVTVTTRGIRRVDELIEQRVVAAAADIEGVVSAPALELVITAVAGNDIVEVRAVDPSMFNNRVVPNPVSCAVET